MNEIGKAIAKLRRERSMTQEELAAIVGVSPQSVSKWENGVTTPDIMLLPVLADLFGVRIDLLFGRKEEKTECIRPGEVYDIVRNHLFETIVRCCDDSRDKATIAQRAETCKRSLKENPHAQTGVFSGDSGALYYSEATGGVLLPRCNGDWTELFDDESAAELLGFLSERNARVLLRTVAQQNGTSFTAASMAKSCGLKRDIAEEILSMLVKYNLISCETVEVEGEDSVEVYRIDRTARPRFLMLYVALTYAKRFVEYRDQYHVWFG